jgi:hypothetical protein
VLGAGGVLEAHPGAVAAVGQAEDLPVSIVRPDGYGDLYLARCGLTLRRGARSWDLVGSAAGFDRDDTALRARAELVERCAMVLVDDLGEEAPIRPLPSSVGVAAHREAGSAGRLAVNEYLERLVAVAFWNGDASFDSTTLAPSVLPREVGVSLGRSGSSVALYGVEDGDATTVIALVVGADGKATVGLGRDHGTSAAADHAVIECLMLQLGLRLGPQGGPATRHQPRLTRRLRALARSPELIRWRLEALVGRRGPGVELPEFRTTLLAATSSWNVVRAEPSKGWGDCPPRSRAWRRGPFA